jgi:RNA polymerase sigma-70 factor, ECF subfamily
LSYSKGSLARRLLENDPEALEQVLRWIATALASPRFWSLRGEWLDLEQEVLARVVESLRLNRFDNSRDFRSYVQGVARFTSLQALSRQPRIASISDTSLLKAADAPSPEREVIDRQLVRRIIDLASEDCRELFRLYFFEVRSYEEIARSLGIPVGTVKSRLFRCLESAHQGVVSSAPRHQHPGQKVPRRSERRVREQSAGRFEYKE